MAQFDILLNKHPQDYTINISDKQSYNVYLDKKSQSYDVYIYNLTSRQSIYGDELDPIIFRLTENDVECLLNIGLLDSALLHRYDDRLVNSLDMYPMSVLDKGGGYNYFALKQDSFELRQSVYAKLEEQIMRLASNVNMALSEIINTECNSITLSTSGDITKITALNTPSLSAKLAHQITSDMSKVCELMLNVCGVHWYDGYLYEYDDMLLSDMYISYPKMSLETLCDKMYMKFSFDIKKQFICLSNGISDFIATVNLKDMIRNNLELTASTNFFYQIICSCSTDIFSIKEPKISIGIVSRINPEDSSAKIDTNTTKDIRTEAILGVVSQTKLNTFMVADEMEAYYGLGYYDNRYLYQWDNHTIHSMSAKVSTTSQNSSVDM